MAWRHDARPPSCLLLDHWLWNGLVRTGLAGVCQRTGACGALPSAVALNGISYNIARSFGPAIGGVIVASAGAVAAFIANALLYLPLLIVLFFWHRLKEPSRLPPERLARAVTSGVRYIVHSPPIRIVLGRTLVTGIAGGSISALMPIVTRDLLHGGAQTYGVMLGAFGMGAVIGALNISKLRGRLGDEVSIRLCMIVMGVSVVLVAISRLPVISGSALVFAGAGWTASVTLFNVGVQLAAPRWVAGRALAAYQAAITGGIALGSWMWGSIANVIGVDGALLISGAALVASPLLGLWMRMPTVSGPNELSLDVLADPEVRLSLTPRSGPIEIEIEYRVDPAKARLFYAVMQHVQLSRQRNGAYGWSIARDIADPQLWTERHHCPTWHDYLRQRSRSTAWSARCTCARTNSISVRSRSGFDECWSALSDLCAGKRKRLIDPPPPLRRLRARGLAPNSRAHSTSPSLSKPVGAAWRCGFAVGSTLARESRRAISFFSRKARRLSPVSIAMRARRR